MKKFLSIVLVITIILSLSGCNFFKKDLSGEYTIDEYIELIKPAKNAGEKAREDLEYGTDEEKSDAYRTAYIKGMQKIGFKGNEKIIIRGKTSKNIYNIYGKERDVFFFTLYNNDEDYVDIRGNYASCGWLNTLEEGTNIKVKCYVDPEYFILENATILSPQRTEYRPDCRIIVPDTHDKIVGEVVNMYSFTLTEKEIDDHLSESSGNVYFWYSAMRYSDMFIIVEDENEYRVGVFIDSNRLPDVNIGDKVWIKGATYDLEQESDTVPRYFMNCNSLQGNFYVFND